jgi:transglutaminase-like putative cysteine protease
MLIKIGFDIELGVASPMALIYLLRVHPSRRDDLVAPEDFRINNDLIADEYIDSFGNHCGGVNVPAGVGVGPFHQLGARSRFGPARRLRPRGAPARPDRAAVLDPAIPAAEPLLRGRQRAPAFAWNQFGQTPPGWQRVQAICDFVHQHIRFDYQRRAPRAPRSTASASGSACAATSRTCASRCAAA